MNQNVKAALALVMPHPLLWIPAALIGLWFAIVAGRKMFGGWDGFLEALRYKFQPGWVSMLRGEFWEDTAAEFKFFFWVVACALVTLAMKIAITKVVVMFSLAERFHLPICLERPDARTEYAAAQAATRFRLLNCARFLSSLAAHDSFCCHHRTRPGNARRAIRLFG